MNSWDLNALDLKPRLPEILSSTEEARAIVLDIAAGQSLSEHEVHERAWVVLVAGEIQATAAGDRAAGVTRALIEFAPEERDQVLASSDAQLLTCGLMLPSERGKAVPCPRQPRGVERRASVRPARTPAAICFMRHPTTISAPPAPPAPRAAMGSRRLSPAPCRPLSHERAAGR